MCLETNKLKFHPIGIATFKKIALLNSPVGNILRHTVKDYEKAFTREELHSLLKIPTSIMGKLFDIFLGKQLPDDLFTDFLSHSSTIKDKLRNSSTNFFASNNNKSGYSLFVNRI